MSASPCRRSTQPITTREAWSKLPSPHEEAKQCLKVALANGGIRSMREMICINDRERTELLAWAEEEPQLASKILGAVAFRDEVVAEFDHLVGMPS